MTERNDDYLFNPNVTYLAETAEDGEDIPDMPTVTIGVFEGVKESSESERKPFDLATATDEDVEQYVSDKPYPEDQKKRMVESLLALRDRTKVSEPPLEPEEFNIRTATDDQIDAHVAKKGYEEEKQKQMKKALRAFRDRLKIQEADEDERGPGTGI